MTKLLSILFLCSLFSCTTIHFRSKNSIPVSFDGNPSQQHEVTITGQRDFYWWGLDPEHQEVFVDDVVRQAGYDGLSKLIIYEKKTSQEVLISFLTFGIYLPHSFSITGYTNGKKLPLEEHNQK